MEGEYHALLQSMMRFNRHCFLISYAQLEALGLYPGQPQMLMALMHREDISQRELAEAMSVKPATLTVMLRRMAGKGLVQRHTDEHDQRVTRLRLTPEGRAVVMRLKDTIEQMGKDIFVTLTQEERRQLSDMLERLSAAIAGKLPKEESSSL